MPPLWDQTGVPGEDSFTHFHSSTTSGSASWMSLRIRFSTGPRPSPSSRMRWSIIGEAELGVRELSFRGTGRPFVGLRADDLPTALRGLAAFAAPRLVAAFFATFAVNDDESKFTVVRPCPSRAIGWLASPNRRVELRRAGRPRGCRGSARPRAWTRRGGRDAATCRGRKPP